MEEIYASPSDSPMSSSSQSPAISGKGKRKIEELDSRVCGICFVDERQVIRGLIDCCDHFFCFLCIMEWAKIESRCPLCKERFDSIRRPPVPGKFSSERVVQVPERNQAQLSNHDPYANTSCFVCNTTEDEHLLLLCDLCDASAHTYCSDLGFTVPDGDWFCPDCAKMKDHHQDSDDHSTSIFDIISDEGSFNVRDPGRGERDRGSQIKDAGRSPVGTVAKTLHQQRDRHLRIQLMRENWSKFRSGSMDFRSTPISLSRHRNSVDDRENTAVGSYDIDRAWKMLELAKSIGKSQPHLPPKSTPVITVPTGISQRRLLEGRVLTVHSGVGSSSNRNSSNGPLQSRTIDRAWNMLELAKSTRKSQSHLPPKSASMVTVPDGISQRSLEVVSVDSEVGSSTTRNSSNGPLQCGPINGGSREFIKKSAAAYHDCNPSSSKTEVQSLVKASLKQKGRHFTKDKFKEVARISTHTILASCGLDHSGSLSRPIPAPACSHLAQSRPSLLRGSCKDCFHAYASCARRIMDSFTRSHSGWALLGRALREWVVDFVLK